MNRDWLSRQPHWIILLLCLLSLLSALAVDYVVEEERDAHRRFVADKVTEMTRAIIDSQRALIDNTRTYLKALATAEAVQRPEDPACGRFLAAQLARSPTFVNLGVAGADGHLRCNARPLGEAVNVADRPYFQRSLKQRTFAIGEFQQDRAAGVTSINFAYPVIGQGGEAVGVAVAVMSLEWWSERLAEFKPAEGVVALISDAQGRVVANYPADASIRGRHRGHYGLAGNAGADRPLVTETATAADGILRAFTHGLLYQSANGEAFTVSLGAPQGEAQSSAIRWLRALAVQFSLLILIILLLAWQAWWKVPRRERGAGIRGAGLDG